MTLLGSLTSLRGSRRTEVTSGSGNSKDLCGRPYARILAGFESVFGKRPGQSGRGVIYCAGENRQVTLT
jgi:hypothetical protein